MNTVTVAYSHYPTCLLHPKGTIHYSLPPTPLCVGQSFLFGCYSSLITNPSDTCTLFYSSDRGRLSKRLIHLGAYYKNYTSAEFAAGTSNVCLNSELLDGYKIQLSITNYKKTFRRLLDLSYSL